MQFHAGDISIVPMEVRERVGSALTNEVLIVWWKTTHLLLNNERPVDVWERDKSLVLGLIDAAKSGDMA